MDTRLGVVAIVVGECRRSSGRVNALLSEYNQIIVGRMGIPYAARDISVIALIVDGDTDTIGALTGKLGGLPGVVAKTTLIPR